MFTKCIRAKTKNLLQHLSQKQFYSTKLDINEISCRTAKSAENLLSNDENHFKIEQKMAFLRHCKHFGITFKILNREIAKPHINLTTKFLLFEKANDRKNAPMRTREKLSKGRTKIYSRKKEFCTYTSNKVSRRLCRSKGRCPYQQRRLRIHLKKFKKVKLTAVCLQKFPIEIFLLQGVGHSCCKN